ncbi:hypothetical protein [Chryseobacterium koreense]|uniref:hypothetical protein n=1 Tax=Chryseobacterium koreense TaxID=232216 RepID=UPI00128DEE77|nr:hypothetical protein [Chryseobacterium koreense]MBB5333237.1 hypothetical protein [Chryseobacterium koreense]
MSLFEIKGLQFTHRDKNVQCQFDLQKQHHFQRFIICTWSFTSGDLDFDLAPYLETLQTE